MIVGMRKVANGELKAGELVLVVSMLGGMVGGKIRGMIDRLRELTQALEPAGRISELIMQEPLIEPMRADHVVVAHDASAKGQILSAFSEAGQVERSCIQDEEGREVAVGAKLRVVGTCVGDMIAIGEEDEAVWEVAQLRSGRRLPYFTTAKLEEESNRRGAKAGQRVRGKQVDGDSVHVDGEYLPLCLNGERALRLVAASRRSLAHHLSDPSGKYPLKFFFTRKLAPSKFKGHIEFQNVEFRYPTEQRVPALRDISFTIEAGKMAALVGHAGCGKSTIFKLIKRLYDPTAGNILLDGQSLKHYDVHHLRRKIAVVAQENILFDTSLLQNVTYGVHPEPTEEEVRKALQQASALEFVEAFPDNIHTCVGSRGLTLSGGQRQRIAIARAMVRSPQILILDEATSALDPANEKIVQAALDALVKNTGATALIIAHRLTTVKDCDNILVFDEGRMVESGTHEELLKIPVERHAPRGKQEKGAIKTGFFHSQWDHMIGEKSAQDDKITHDAEQQLASLRAQVQELEQQVERFQLAERARQFESFAEKFGSPGMLSLSRAQSDPPHIEPETCQGWSSLSLRKGVMDVPPSPLLLHERMRTA